MNEKYTICFSLLSLFANDEKSPYRDFDQALRSIRDRGFNTVRIDSGAGCFHLPDGTPRPAEVSVKPPFGKYSKIVRQSNVISLPHIVNLKERLLELLRAARKYEIKIILSSWMLIHTYWILDRAYVEPIFSLTAEEKIAYFARELDVVLSFVREAGYIDRIAFAEILNEFDGLDFCNGYRQQLPEEEAFHIREEHEKAIAALRAHHPDVSLAYDSFTAYPQKELIPRNIDVLNFHLYYLWNIVKPFENGVVEPELSEPVIPPETARWLTAEPVTVREILEIVGEFRSVPDWARRVALHSSVEPCQILSLEKVMTEQLEKDQDLYRENLKKGIDFIVAVRDEVVPRARLVMGEGVNYCCSNWICAEDRSETYWRILAEQADLLRERGLDGTVVRTTSDPEDPCWETRNEDMLAINRRFLKGIL